MKGNHKLRDEFLEDLRKSLQHNKWTRQHYKHQKREFGENGIAQHKSSSDI